jgi:leader peptidase (prepilin peptidase)/N-methyltransferase
MAIFILAIVAIAGMLVGSFLNVCILRIPSGESIVGPPSHCPNCDTRLKWYELIPILSYLAQRGKCRTCEERISPQYPLIEAGNGALWVLVWWVLGPSYGTVVLWLTFGLDYGWDIVIDGVTVPAMMVGAALGALLASVLLAISVIDARTKEIPLGLNITIAVLGILRILTNLPLWYEHLIGVAAVSLPLYAILVLSKGRGIGGGDVKLMAACGLFLGWRLIILAFFVGCVIGTVIHLIRMAAAKAGRELAFGPYLAAGAFIALLWGNPLIAFYINTFFVRT